MPQRTTSLSRAPHGSPEPRPSSAEEKENEQNVSNTTEDCHEATGRTSLERLAQEAARMASSRFPVAPHDPSPQPLLVTLSTGTAGEDTSGEFVFLSKSAVDRWLGAGLKSILRVVSCIGRDPIQLQWLGLLPLASGSDWITDSRVVSKGHRLAQDCAEVAWEDLYCVPQAYVVRHEPAKQAQQTSTDDSSAAQGASQNITDSFFDSTLSESDFSDDNTDDAAAAATATTPVASPERRGGRSKSSTLPLSLVGAGATADFMPDSDCDSDDTTEDGCDYFAESGGPPRPQSEDEDADTEEEPNVTAKPPKSSLLEVRDPLPELSSTGVSLSVLSPLEDIPEALTAEEMSNPDTDDESARRSASRISHLSSRVSCLESANRKLRRESHELHSHIHRLTREKEEIQEELQRALAAIAQVQQAVGMITIGQPADRRARAANVPRFKLPFMCSSGADDQSSHSARYSDGSQVSPIQSPVRQHTVGSPQSEDLVLMDALNMAP